MMHSTAKKILPVLSIFLFSISGCSTMETYTYRECAGITIFGIPFLEKDRSGDPATFPPVEVVDHDVSNLALARQGYALYGKAAVCRPTEETTTAKTSLQDVVDEVRQYHMDLLVQKETLSATHRVLQSTYYSASSASAIPHTVEAAGGGTLTTYSYTPGSSGGSYTDVKGYYSSEDTVYYIWRRDPKLAGLQAVGFAVIEGDTKYLKEYLAKGGDVDIIPFRNIPEAGYYHQTSSWNRIQENGTTSRPFIKIWKNTYDYSTNDEFTLTELAIANGQVSMLKLLLNRGGKNRMFTYESEEYLAHLPQKTQAEIKNILGIKK